MEIHDKKDQTNAYVSKVGEDRWNNCGAPLEIPEIRDVSKDRRISIENKREQIKNHEPTLQHEEKWAISNQCKNIIYDFDMFCFKFKGC